MGPIGSGDGDEHGVSFPQYGSCILLYASRFNVPRVFADFSLMVILLFEKINNRNELRYRPRIFFRLNLEARFSTVQ